MSSLEKALPLPIGMTCTIAGCAPSPQTPPTKKDSHKQNYILYIVVPGTSTDSTSILSCPVGGVVLVATIVAAAAIFIIKR